MAAMTTALTEFASFGDSHTSTTSGHTVLKPKVVVEKRKVPVGNQTVSEYNCSVVHATEDSEGNVLPQKINMSISVRIPIQGLSTDVDAALLILRDIVAGDEFGNSVNTQEFL